VARNEKASGKTSGFAGDRKKSTGKKTRVLRSKDSHWGEGTGGGTGKNSRGRDLSSQTKGSKIEKINSLSNSRASEDQPGNYNKKR